MKKLFTSTLLTVAAVPFLMAAPKAAKKTQNQPAASTQSTTVKPKAQKKHVRKAKSANSSTENNAAPASSSPKQ